MSGELIGAREAASRLGLSHVQVTRLCHNGTLQYTRVGNALVIDADSVTDASARRKAGRPRKWKGEWLVKELRARGHELMAIKIERIFHIRR